MKNYYKIAILIGLMVLGVNLQAQRYVSIAASTDPTTPADIFDAIKYALPTVTIVEEGGQRKIMMRGATSFTQSNAALTLVDGIIMDDISAINPADVTSIDQLSSAKAAIYGSRGVNGAINITTREI